MANINKVRLNGTTYDLQDKNAAKTVELTQEQYDGLAVKEQNVFYIITDAQGGDLSNYYTKGETDTLLGEKQPTLVSGTNLKTINNESLLGEGNINIQGGGGGKAVNAGTNISITTGETADTINCTLNLVNGGGTNSIKMKDTYRSNGIDSFSIGGSGVEAAGQCSFAGGSYSKANRFSSMAFGRYVTTNNYGEVALGFYNQSNGSSSDEGNISSSNTLFSVGNGRWDSRDIRHNAFEIRQNGDIYVPNTDDTSVTGEYAYSLYPMVRLQDTITATAANTTALGGLKLVKLSQSEYDALQTKDSSTLYIIVN